MQIVKMNGYYAQRSTNTFIYKTQGFYLKQFETYDTQAHSLCVN